MSVSDKDISVKIKSSGEVVSLPHGLILWSTGVGTRPVISDLMEQVGQGGRRALATNEWLQVKGCENVYAVGDCASIAQRKIMGDIANIFKAADVDNSGTLTEEELQDVVEDIIVRYPQVELYLKSKHVRSIKDLLTDSEGNPKKEVDIKAFESALSGVDSQMKSLPATAQVHFVACPKVLLKNSCLTVFLFIRLLLSKVLILQNALIRWSIVKSILKVLSVSELEGITSSVLSSMPKLLHPPFNSLKDRDETETSFFVVDDRYKHFGQFAPLGGDQAAAELPGDWVSAGRSTQWLWYSVYAR